MSSLCLLSVDDVYEQYWLAAEWLMVHKIKPRLSAAQRLPSGSHVVKACWEYKFQTDNQVKTANSSFFFPPRCTPPPPPPLHSAFLYGVLQRFGVSRSPRKWPPSQTLAAASAWPGLRAPSLSFLRSGLLGILPLPASRPLRFCRAARQSMTKTLSFCC